MSIKILKAIYYIAGLALVLSAAINFWQSDLETGIAYMIAFAWWAAAAGND